LRQNQKVVVLEGNNARNLEELPDDIDLATIDVSFISSKVLLPVIRGWFRDSGGQVILLVKPQFEAGKSEVSRGKGVIRDPKVHQQVLWDVLEYAQDAQYQILGLIKSPLFGPKGNTEFLAWLDSSYTSRIDVELFIKPLFNDVQFMG